MAIKIDDLSIAYKHRGELRRVVESVSLDIREGEIVGVVGESGCGKSTLALSMIQLLPENAVVLDGAITSGGQNYLTLGPESMRRKRGSEVAMIFQDPFTALNPVFTIGNQIAETLEIRAGLSRSDAIHKTVELLQAVEIRDPEKRIHSYPHQLSGGERQRVMIAIAISGRPKLLIADEPTTALDVTVQKGILELLQKLRAQYGMSILLITHNFGIVAQMCDRVAVMYAGRIVELASKDTILSSPLHPYTKALLQSIPRLGHKGKLPTVADYMKEHS